MDARADQRPTIYIFSPYPFLKLLTSHVDDVYTPGLRKQSTKNQGESYQQQKSFHLEK